VRVEGTEAENERVTYNWAKKNEACPQHDELVPPVIDSSGCVRFLMSRGEETMYLDGQLIFTLCITDRR